MIRTTIPQKLPLVLKCHLLLLAFLCYAVVYLPNAYSQNKPAGNMVELVELQNGNQYITGKLGVRIGTVVRITGKWHAPEKSNIITKDSPKRRFEILTVDGNRIDQKILFSEGDIMTIANRDVHTITETTFMAYESCEYEGVPAAAYDHVRPTSQRGPFTLHSKLIMLIE
jgi:hypothetical protein